MTNPAQSGYYLVMLPDGETTTAYYYSPSDEWFAEYGHQTLVIVGWSEAIITELMETA